MNKKALIAGALLFSAVSAHAAVDVRAMAGAGASPQSIVLALMVDDGLSLNDAVEAAAAADSGNAAAYRAARAKVKAAQASLAMATGASTAGFNPGGNGGGTSGGGGGNAVQQAVDQVLQGTKN